MKKIYIAVAVFVAAIFAVYALLPTDLEKVIDNSCEYILESVPEPTVSTTGGEWAVTALARSEYEVPEGYFEIYYNNLKKQLEENNGKLHATRYTEYSRAVIALTATGISPENVGGYNLLMPLADFEKTVKQGITGAAYALLALDSGDYEIPENPDAEIQATREMYIERILSRQNEDGGFSLTGNSDADVTAMVLQALAKYRENSEIENAVEKALSCLSEMQMENGGFESMESANAESIAQVVMAFCELGADFEDERFVKNGNTVLDALEKYYSKNAGFFHSLNSNGNDIIATEQVLCALVNAARVKEGRNTFYNMSDVKKGD